MNKKIKLIGYISVILIISSSVFIALHYVYRVKPDSSEQISEGVPVAIAIATKEKKPVFLTGIGELEATQQVMVTAETGGLVTTILFQPGEPVIAGQTLLQLNDAPEQGQLTSLKAKSANAQAQLTRTNMLFRQQASTQEELEQARANLQQLQGEVARTQALINQKRIKAPFSGVLGIRKVNPGQFVHAGDAMVSLTDTKMLYANITLPEHALPAVKKHQKMIITVDAYPDKEFNGEITTIEPIIDKGTRNLIVQATISNQGKILSSGMYAKGKIILSTPQDIIRVPETAVSFNAYGDFIYVIDDTKAGSLTARQVYIKTGERSDGYITITEGIEAGDKVITSGQLRLGNGSTVEILPTDTLSVGRDNTTAQ